MQILTKQRIDYGATLNERTPVAMTATCAALLASPINANEYTN